MNFWSRRRSPSRHDRLTDGERLRWLWSPQPGRTFIIGVKNPFRRALYKAAIFVGFRPILPGLGGTPHPASATESEGSQALQFQIDGVPPEELKRLLEQMPEPAIAPSPLVGVVAVAAVTVTSGITVEVLSVELREAGAIVHWRSRADRSVGFLQPQVAVTDDHGTAYRVSAANGGGDHRSWAGEIALTPAPARGATLTLVIEVFGADERMRMSGFVAADPVQGPWSFQIETRDIRER